MLKDFNDSVTKKTDQELLEYLSNIDRYSPEALMFVINELKIRGRKFSDEELRTINLKINKTEGIIPEEPVFRPFFSLKKNIVTDSNAPLFYSQISILVFSTFFSVIFGSILFSLNVGSMLKKGIVIAYGVAVTSFSLYVATLAPYSSFYMIIINAVGGCLLVHEIWNRMIGQKIRYRSRPILVPLFIAVLLTLIGLTISQL